MNSTSLQLFLQIYVKSPKFPGREKVKGGTPPPEPITPCLPRGAQHSANTPVSHTAHSTVQIPHLLQENQDLLQAFSTWTTLNDFHQNYTKCAVTLNSSRQKHFSFFLMVMKVLKTILGTIHYFHVHLSKKVSCKPDCTV